MVPMTGVNLWPIKLFLLCFVSLLCVTPQPHAERLYHWTDENGEIHITQEAPPQSGQLKEIMDYSHESEQKSGAEGAQTENVQDPYREEKLKLEFEKRKVEGTKAGILNYEQEKRAKRDEPAGPNACFVELPAQDMYVRVFDIAESGSRGSRIWGADMKKFERRIIQSTRGKVSIDFKLGPRESYYSIEVRICNNGNVIQILPR